MSENLQDTEATERAAAASPLLSDEVRAAIRDYFPRYPTRQAVVLPALHVVNDRLGHVPPQAVAEVAELLELAPAQVQDTLSFYGFFHQDGPQGRFRVWVCRSIGCAARGGEELLDYLAQRAGYSPGPDHARWPRQFAVCRMSGRLRVRPGDAGQRDVVQGLDQGEDRPVRGVDRQ